MANNKYLAHNGHLIGTVMMNKPHQSRWGDYTGDPATADSVADEWDRYDQHITSMSEKPLPCYGWTPEEGKVYVEGKDFKIMRKADKVRFENEKEVITPGERFAVPITPFQSDSPFEVEHPEEGAAYLTPASPTEQAEGGEVHELKIWPEYFDDVDSGKKPFEVRKADRLFGTGDILWLREWSPTKGYSGRETRKRVTYILHGGQWGIQEGNCVMGIAPQSQPPAPVQGYPAEFVEWVAIDCFLCTQTPLPFTWQIGRIGNDQYSLPELFQYWKSIKSKEK